MAAHCLSLLSVTDVLCEHLLTEDEVRLYGTCSSIYDGNKTHRDILLDFRNYIYGYNVTPTLQHSQRSTEQLVVRACFETRLEDLVDRRPGTMHIADDPCRESD